MSGWRDPDEGRVRCVVTADPCNRAPGPNTGRARCGRIVDPCNKVTRMRSPTPAASVRSPCRRPARSRNRRTAAPRTPAVGIASNPVSAIARLPDREDEPLFGCRHDLSSRSGRLGCRSGDCTARRSIPFTAATAGPPGRFTSNGAISIARWSDPELTGQRRPACSVLRDLSREGGWRGAASQHAGSPEALDDGRFGQHLTCLGR